MMASTVKNGIDRLRNGNQQRRATSYGYFGREGLGRQRLFLYGNGAYSLYVPLQSDTFKEIRDLILLSNA